MYFQHTVFVCFYFSQCYSNSNIATYKRSSRKHHIFVEVDVLYRIVVPLLILRDLMNKVKQNSGCMLKERIKNWNPNQWITTRNEDFIWVYRRIECIPQKK